MADPLDQQPWKPSSPDPGGRRPTSRRPSSRADLRASRVALAKVEDDEDEDEDRSSVPIAAATDAEAVATTSAWRSSARTARRSTTRCRSTRRPSSMRRSRGAHRGAARRDPRRHDRDRRPGPDVPQGDRQGRPADRRGGGRPGEGDRAGEQLVEEPGRASSRSTSGRSTTPSARPGPRSRSTACRSATRRTTWSARRSPDGANDLLVASPDFHLVRPARRAVGRDEGAAREAKKLARRLGEKRDAETFLEPARLGVPRRPQRRPRLAGQRRPAGDLRLDPRRRGVPRARALDHGRQGGRAPQAHGPRPGIPSTRSSPTARASSSASGETPASS